MLLTNQISAGPFVKDTTGYVGITGRNKKTYIQRIYSLKQLKLPKPQELEMMCCWKHCDMAAITLNIVWNVTFQNHQSTRDRLCSAPIFKHAKSSTNLKPQKLQILVPWGCHYTIYEYVRCNPTIVIYIFFKDPVRSVQNYNLKLRPKSNLLDIKIPVQWCLLELYVFSLKCLVTDASQGLELWPQII